MDDSDVFAMPASPDPTTYFIGNMTRKEFDSFFRNLTDDQASYLLHILYNISYSSTSTQVLPDCDLGIKDSYKNIHGYLSLLICIFGTIANLFNIIILTRREMVNSTNNILTGLAIADFLLLSEYIVYSAFFIQGHETLLHSYSHTAFVLFHANFTQVAHTVTIFLTITLAVWRYIAICKPHLNLVLCTLPRSRIAVAVAYIVGPLLSIPNFVMFSIHHQIDTKENSSQYRVDFSPWISGNERNLIRNIHLWFYGGFIKLLPCLLLSFFIFRIIKAMYIAKRRKENLIKLATPTLEMDRKMPRMEKLTEKTTRMLLTVLILFLVTEFPQGILVFLSGVYGDIFFRKCYMAWGDIMDLLALINSAINFILYYIMSHQFRVTFHNLIKRPKSENVSPRIPGETVSTQL